MLVDKKVLAIHISGNGIGIPKMEQINSIKKEKSFPIMGIPVGDNEHRYFLSLTIMEDELDDIQIDYKDISEERENKLNQIL